MTRKPKTGSRSGKGRRGRFRRFVKDLLLRIRLELAALYLAIRHPATPWYAKALAGFVVAYALSPIDLIPDFIPVIGYLDDAIIVPLGIWLCVKMIPAPVMAECRTCAAKLPAPKRNIAAAVVIVCIWIILLVWLVAALLPLLKHHG
jgi:uncharacterized membrane protein YkvA (DUF1232 family)